MLPLLCLLPTYLLSHLLIYLLLFLHVNLTVWGELVFYGVIFFPSLLVWLTGWLTELNALPIADFLIFCSPSVRSPNEIVFSCSGDFLVRRS